MNAKVVGKVVFDCGAEKVSCELADLARNGAALIGGNTIVPISGIIDGRRTFAVYQCFPSNRNY